MLCSNIGSGMVADVTLGPSDYFGERALMTEEPRAADVTAITHVECITISREVCLGGDGGGQRRVCVGCVWGGGDRGAGGGVCRG